MRYTTEPPLEKRADVRAILGKHGVTLDEVIALDRHPAIVLARRELMHHLWQGGLTMVRIGALLKRNHSTVSDAVASVNRNGYSRRVE